MSKILYIDACAGLSGDMLAGGLLDLGWPLSELKQMVELMDLHEVELEQVRMEHGGIMASRLGVNLLPGHHHHHDGQGHSHEGHEHHHHGEHGHSHDGHEHHHHGDHEHAYDGHEHHHHGEHGHSHEGHEHHHHGDHEHAHDGHEHHHHGEHGHSQQGHEHTHNRKLPDILKLLQRLPAQVAEPAARVFQRLAQAEAKVHGTSPDEVHFHEVGAADAIVDITAFCAGIHWLGVERIVCSPIPLGSGFVQCAHGRIPLPAPAVLNLLEGLPVKPWPEDKETVTPTGAALVSTLCRDFGALPAMKLERTGIGCGTRVNRYAPNILRLMLGEDAATAGPLYDTVVEIVCHVDDMNPEDLPLAYERLFAQGALDVSTAPLFMKKGRPGLALTVMAKPEQAEALAQCVLEQTTSLGVRMREATRMVLPRRMATVETPWGAVKVKLSLAGKSEKAHVESDDVLDICRRTGQTPPQVRQWVLEHLNDQAG